MIRFRYRQTTDQGVWTSDVFEAATLHDVRRGVLAGWIGGADRWAVSDTDGRFLAGIDRKGKDLTAPPNDAGR